jgi:hypothetical protein
VPCCAYPPYGYYGYPAYGGYGYPVYGRYGGAVVGGDIGYYRGGIGEDGIEEVTAADTDFEAPRRHTSSNWLDHPSRAISNSAAASVPIPYALGRTGLAVIVHVQPSIIEHKYPSFENVIRCLTLVVAASKRVKRKGIPMATESIEQRVDVLRETIVALVRRDGPDLSARQFGVFFTCYTLTLREPERIACQSVRSGFC